VRGKRERETRRGGRGCLVRDKIGSSSIGPDSRVGPPEKRQQIPFRFFLFVVLAFFVGKSGVNLIRKLWLGLWSSWMDTVGIFLGACLVPWC
jgi:hypothetical protein